MALVLKDRVQETTTTTGTGTVTLAGAVTGFQSFSVIGNGNTTYYTISGGSEWEVGIGTYTASGTTLSRDTVLESSNSGSLVNFSAGSKTVFCTYPAERSMYVDGTTITPATTATLPVASGGTGANTLTANAVILGNTTSAVQFVAPGTSANVLTSNGTTWVSQAPAAAGVTSVTGTAPIASSGGSTPAISISQATASTNGYLSSTDWNTFNGKQAALVSGTNIKTVNSNSLLGSGNISVGTVTSVATGTGLSGGTITSTGTISLANTAVSAGSYTNTNLTVDAQGRITAASNGSSGGSTTLGAVGTYAFLGSTTNAAGPAAGGTKAGSSLRYAGVVSTQGGSSAAYGNVLGVSGTVTNNVAGTWQAMGRDPSGLNLGCSGAGYGYTLWIRTV